MYCTCYMCNMYVSTRLFVHIICIYISVYMCILHMYVTCVYDCMPCINWRKMPNPNGKKDWICCPQNTTQSSCGFLVCFCRKIVMYIEGACLPTTWHGNQTTFVACQYLSLKTKKLKMCSRHDCRIAICYAHGCTERSSKAKSLS